MKFGLTTHNYFIALLLGNNNKHSRASRADIANINVSVFIGARYRAFSPPRDF